MPSGAALIAKSRIRSSQALGAGAHGIWMLIKSPSYSRGDALLGAFGRATAAFRCSHVVWVWAPQPSTTAFAARVATFNFPMPNEIKRAALIRPYRTTHCVQRSFVRGEDTRLNHVLTGVLRLILLCVTQSAESPLRRRLIGRNVRLRDIRDGPLWRGSPSHAL
jgi:hypothetical protein